MLNESNYPEEVQRHFLSYFRDTLCPQLGSRPDGTSVKSCVGWDGNPFEYSFELKDSTKSPAVRFGVDLTQLRSADNINPLSMATAQKVVDSLAERTPGTAPWNTWSRKYEWYDGGKSIEKRVKSVLYVFSHWLKSFTLLTKETARIESWTRRRGSSHSSALGGRKILPRKVWVCRCIWLQSYIEHRAGLKHSVGKLTLYWTHAAIARCLGEHNVIQITTQTCLSANWNISRMSQSSIRSISEFHLYRVSANAWKVSFCQMLKRGGVFPVLSSFDITLYL